MESNLIKAVKENNLELVELLVYDESCLQDSNYMTALMHAAKNGYLECVNILVSHESGMRDKNGNTALMHAIITGNYEIANLLVPYEARLQNNAFESALMFAVSGFNLLDIVRQLVPYEIRIRNTNGMTALMYACISNKSEYIECLLPYVAGAQDKLGMTALMYAANRNYISCITDSLIDKEAKLEDHLGMTALMLAAQNDYHEIVKLLIPFEAGMKNNKNMTALGEAIVKKSMNSIKLLLDAEKDIKILNDEPIEIFAVLMNDISILKIIDIGSKEKYFKYLHEYIILNYKCLPYIKKDSFVDILNLAIKRTASSSNNSAASSSNNEDTHNSATKQTTLSYEESMLIMCDHIQQLIDKDVKYIDEILSYDKFTILQIDDLVSKLSKDFPDYSEQLEIIRREATDDFILNARQCEICYEETTEIYRNCINCKLYACLKCWHKMEKCPHCNLKTTKYKKCLNSALISCINDKFNN